MLGFIVVWKYIHYHKYNRSPVGMCCMMQGNQTHVLSQPKGIGWGGRWAGGLRGRGHIYTYG